MTAENRSAPVPIDRGVLPLVVALNANGRFRTIASCQVFSDNKVSS
ncbi:hypothetical protein HF673_18250 [Acidithiobacillus thiooxidans]|nr:hypothetical protein [Acidithiobacillus thiooxidans]MBU2837625.1 hypothetical protein [Acidithiobacillus thiooxidans]